MHKGVLMTIAEGAALRAGVQTTIEALAAMLSEDGAALTLLAVDPSAPSVELTVQLEDLECQDCVLPPDRLRATIAAALERDLGESFAVLLHDPRDPPGPPEPATVAAEAALCVPPAPNVFVVLDPSGIAPDDGALDAGPDAGPLAGKTVAIRHDVLWPSFDWTVEEWTRSLEQAGATVETFRRAQGQKDEQLLAADAEFEATLARADLAISGLGNCGSCTSWSVRDALIAASKGLPTTVVATAHFESLAHLLAADGGRPGLRVTVLPYPYSTLDEATVRGHARTAFRQLLDVLGASV